jgi:DnaJ-class molecular chaperone
MAGNEYTQDVRKLIEGGQCYEILGVEPNASKDEIKKAYRSQIKKCHPDKFPDKEKEFIRLTGAYGILQDAVKKAEHDKNIGIQPLKTDTFEGGSEGAGGFAEKVQKKSRNHKPVKPDVLTPASLDEKVMHFLTLLWRDLGEGYVIHNPKLLKDNSVVWGGD